jgi:hypothetical protein
MKKFVNSKTILTILLVIMAAMIIFAVISRDLFISVLRNATLLRHARFLHITASCLFFSNAMVGILWERKSLSSGNKEIIIHTYNTVAIIRLSIFIAFDRSFINRWAVP